MFSRITKVIKGAEEWTPENQAIRDPRYLFTGETEAHTILQMKPSVEARIL